MKAGIPKLGIMVEVPLAALSIEKFDVDFYSIGNDLIQYLSATARIIVQYHTFITQNIPHLGSNE